MRKIFKILKAKRIDNIDKYKKLLDNHPIPNYEHWDNFEGYQNNLDTDNISSSFKNKKIVINDNLSKWEIAKIANKGTTFEKTINVMNWLTNHTYYSGMSTRLIKDKTSKILNKTLNKNFKFALNCRLKAIVLTDMLLSIGINAVPLLLLGVTPVVDKKPLWGCHFMVHIYLKENNKWIVVDPSFNVYFEHNNQVLNIIELSNLLSKNIFPKLVGYNFNGSTSDCVDIYKNLFLKGCIEFIHTWESGKRTFYPFQKMGGCQFNYILEPNNCNLLQALKQINIERYLGKKILNGYPKKITRINVDDLLSIKL